MRLEGSKTGCFLIKDVEEMMLRVIYGTVIWVIVPCIVLAMLILAIIIIVRATGEPKVAARAGFWAGLLVFVVYVISRLPVIQVPDFSLNNLPNFNFSSWVLLILGFAVGFCILWGISNFMPLRLIGVITLLLSASTTCALFSYLFDISVRYTVMYFALGTIIGILVNIIFFPENIRVLRSTHGQIL